MIIKARPFYVLPESRTSMSNKARRAFSVAGRVLGYVAGLVFCVAFWIVFWFAAFAGVLAP